MHHFGVRSQFCPNSVDRDAADSNTRRNARKTGILGNAKTRGKIPNENILTHPLLGLFRPNNCEKLWPIGFCYFRSCRPKRWRLVATSNCSNRECEGLRTFSFLLHVGGGENRPLFRVQPPVWHAASLRVRVHAHRPSTMSVRIITHPTSNTPAPLGPQGGCETPSQ